MTSGKIASPVKFKPFGYENKFCKLVCMTLFFEKMDVFTHFAGCEIALLRCSFNFRSASI